MKILTDRGNLKTRKNNVKMELFKIKQTGNYDEFFSKFQELANESGMGQDDLILLFSNALKPKCGLEVQIREPETIEEAYKIASKFESNFNKLKSSETIHKTNMVKREFRNKNNDKYRGKWSKSTKFRKRDVATKDPQM